MKLKYIWNAFLFISAFSLVSCGEEFDFLRNATPATNGARIKVFHAAPDVPGWLPPSTIKLFQGY